MSAALRLVDFVEPACAPTLSPPSLAAPRSSMCPTLLPRALGTQRPANDDESFETHPPMTQRSATLSPRGFGPAQHDTYDALAIMRMNVEFLESLLGIGAPAVAHEAFHDLHRSIDRLERRCAAGVPLAAKKGSHR
jgi:hypothetical protein